MSRLDIPVKVKTGNYEVLTSGVVHTKESDISFEIAGLKINFIFKSDDGTARFQGVTGDKSLTIEIFNTNNILGEGKLEPIEIGTIGGQSLNATWFINTLEGTHRQFNYTFLLKDK